MGLTLLQHCLIRLIHNKSVNRTYQVAVCSPKGAGDGGHPSLGGVYEESNSQDGLGKQR